MALFTTCSIIVVKSTDVRASCCYQYHGSRYTFTLVILPSWLKATMAVAIRRQDTELFVKVVGWLSTGHALRDGAGMSAIPALLKKAEIVRGAW